MGGEGGERAKRHCTGMDVHRRNAERAAAVRGCYLENAAKFGATRPRKSVSYRWVQPPHLTARQRQVLHETGETGASARACPSSRLPAPIHRPNS